MGVYVKEMTTPYGWPRSCEYCTFKDRDWPGYCEVLEHPVKWKDACPLVPVKTPHGRLIDADALVRRLNEIGAEPDYQHENEDWQVGLILAEDAIYDAPTVIEAEEG